MAKSIIGGHRSINILVRRSPNNHTQLRTHLEDLKQFCELSGNQNISEQIFLSLLQIARNFPPKNGERGK